MVRITLGIALLALGIAKTGPGSPPAWAHLPDATSAMDCPETTAAENEAIARRWFEDALNGADLAVIDEILAADVVYHSGALGELSSGEVVAAVLEPILVGFPDVNYTIDQVLTRDDVVVLIWRAQGTHTGEFQGYAPTGRPAAWTGINVYRFECGRVAEAWAEADSLGRLRQLGVVGTPAP